MTVAWSGRSTSAGAGRNGQCFDAVEDEAASAPPPAPTTTPLPARPSSWTTTTTRRSKSTGASVSVSSTSSSSSLPVPRPAFRRFSVELSTEALFRAFPPSDGVGSGSSSLAGGEDNAKEEEADLGRAPDDSGGIGGRGGGGSVAAASASSAFYGAYADIRRSRIDYSYHATYRKERQWLHDSIIVDLLEGGGRNPPADKNNLHGSRHGSVGTDGDDDDDGGAKEELGDDNDDDGSSTSSSSSVQILECAARHFHQQRDNDDDAGGSGGCEAEAGAPKIADVCHPWFILTAGPQGAGKRYAVEQLVQRGAWSFSTLIVVDSDEIRRSLPEYATYVEQVPDHADRLTGKEAGYIGETMLWAALRESKTVVLDSCLKDAGWYSHLVEKVRIEHPQYKVALVHVSCPDDRVLCERSRRRSRDTGREISLDTIREQLAGLPRSIDTVAPVVDRCFNICNETDLCLFDGTTWEDFADAFRSRRECKESRRQKQPQIPSPAACSSHKRRSLRRFSVLRSSEENHRSDDTNFYGKYAHLRKTLDYTFHCNYTFERQMFQDAVVDHFLKAAVIMDKNGELCTTPTEPWIVFTAGAMGAGKSHTMRILVENGHFPLLAFVNVDPDRIRYFIPEFHMYLEQNAELAGELTRKEAGFIAEILTLAGLHAGKNVLVDGSLRDHGWYKEYFSRLRTDFPGLRIAILHVTAPREAVFQRAEERALVTGRVVPRKLISEALEQVPCSVRILAPLVDYQVELSNASDDGCIDLVTEGETWETFKSHWIQTCAWLPSQRLKKKLSKRAESSSTSLHSSESSYNKA